MPDGYPRLFLRWFLVSLALLLAPRAVQAQLLAVELMSFEAVPAGDDVQVTWSTASERGSLYYAVEMSPGCPDGGRAFHEQGRVAAAGTSTVTRPYQFLDQHVDATELSRYYRLIAMDSSGNRSISQTREVRFTRPPLAVSAAPNPFAGNLNVNILAPLDSLARINLTELAGRSVWQQTVSLLPCRSVDVVLPTAALRAALYILEVTAGGRRQRQLVMRL